MILCVTPNQEWDLTCTLPAVEPGRIHHVTDIAEPARGRLEGAAVLAPVACQPDPIAAEGYGFGVVIKDVT